MKSSAKRIITNLLIINMFISVALACYTTGNQRSISFPYLCASHSSLFTLHYSLAKPLSSFIFLNSEFPLFYFFTLF